MKWNEIEFDVLNAFPELISDVVSVGSFKCRYYILPSGFKDLRKILIFGELEGKNHNDMALAIKRIEEIAQQYKLDKIIGPIDYSTYFDYRIKLSSLEETHFVGEPHYCYEYFESLMKMGFKVDQMYFSHEFKVKNNFLFFFKIVLIGLWASLVNKNRIKLINIDSINYKIYLKSIFELIDSAFSNNYMYQKIPYLLFLEYFEKKILPFIDKESSVLAISNQSELVGFSLCLKDQTQNKRLLFKTIGVKKTYKNGAFIGRQLMYEVFKSARKRYQSCMACLMIEGNKPELWFRKISFRSISYGLVSKKIIPNEKLAFDVESSNNV